MKTSLLLILGILIGGALGVVGGGAVGTGLGAGTGSIEGLKSGACLAVESAKDQGLITSEQVGAIFAGVAKTANAEAPGEPAVSLPLDDAECREVIADMTAAIAARE